MGFMDNFLQSWLPNIVVNAIFYLLERPRRTVAVISAWLAVRWLRKKFARTDRPSGDLTPAAIGNLSGPSVSTSLAVGHLTAIPANTPTMLNIPYSAWHRDSDATHHHAVQEILRFERNKTAAQLAHGAIPSGIAYGEPWLAPSALRSSTRNAEPMNTGTAISAAVLTGLVAGELQELATPPEKQPRLHAPADATHSAGPHLEYEGFRANFVTVPLNSARYGGDSWPGPSYQPAAVCSLHCNARFWRHRRIRPIELHN
jgi:hypothetical protein